MKKNKTELLDIAFATRAATLRKWLLEFYNFRLTPLQASDILAMLDEIYTPRCTNCRETRGAGYFSANTQL